MIRFKSASSMWRNVAQASIISQQFARAILSTSANQPYTPQVFLLVFNSNKSMTNYDNYSRQKDEVSYEKSQLLA